MTDVSDELKGKIFLLCDTDLSDNSKDLSKPKNNVSNNIVYKRLSTDAVHNSVVLKLATDTPSERSPIQIEGAIFSVDFKKAIHDLNATIVTEFAENTTEGCAQYAYDLKDSERKSLESFVKENKCKIAKTIATFDDMVSPKWFNEIVDFLDKKQSKATD